MKLLGFRRLALELDVILQPHAGDHVELLLQRVDMILLIFQDFAEQIAADLIADAFAMGDGAAKLGQRF